MSCIDYYSVCRPPSGFPRVTPEVALTEWFVDEIVGHRWKSKSIEFLVKWNLGDSTWEPLTNCNDLAALDAYLTLMDIKEWQELPKRVTKMSRSDTCGATCTN